MTENVLPDKIVWENAIIEHYLNSEGPAGTGPITYIDATPGELAVAINRPTGLELTPEQAKESFIGSFKGENIRFLFSSGQWIPKPEQNPLAIFRYLLLTCLVPALHDDLTDSTKNNQFRHRFGKLTQETGYAMQNFKGLATLWEYASEQLNSLHFQGQPFRTLQLPNPGPWRIIGYSLKLSFPSWRDRNRLTRLLDGQHFDTSRSVMIYLDKHLPASTGGGSLWVAYDDFRHSPIPSRHRFWLLVKSIIERRASAALLSSAPSTVLKLIMGIEEEPTFVLSRPDNDVGDVVVSESFEQIALEIHKTNDSRLLRFLNFGCFILERSNFSDYTSDYDGEPIDYFVIVASNQRRTALGNYISWTKIGPNWSLSQRLDEVTAPMKHHQIFAQEDLDLADAELVDGIKLNAKTYLGRPHVLPYIQRFGDFVPRLTPVGTTFGTLQIQRVVTRLAITTTTPVVGKWDIEWHKNSEYYGSQQIQFHADALIHDHLKDPGARSTAWTKDREIGIEIREDISPNNVRVGQVKIPKGTQPDAKIADLCEILYAIGKGGIPEYRICPLIRDVMEGDGPGVWDTLRMFREAGWLDAYYTANWGARVWFLRPPTLIQHTADDVLEIDGAIPMAWLEHLETAVRAIGGSVNYRWSPSPWSVPSIFVKCVDGAALAQELGWGLRTARRPVVNNSPAFWEKSPHDTAGRIIASTWSWEERRFKSGQNIHSGISDVNMVRWKRARGDVNDIFVVSGGKATELITPSRTAAILEGHRRNGIPLFSAEHDSLIRISNDGHLPIELIRFLRSVGCVTSGPEIASDDKIQYRYFLPASEIIWLRSLLGSSISATSRDTPTTSGVASAQITRRMPNGRYTRNRSRFFDFHTRAKP